MQKYTCKKCKSTIVKSIKYKDNDYCGICFRQMAINLINNHTNNLYKLKTEDLFALLTIYNI